MTITWKPVTRKLSDLQPWKRNPRQINKRQAKRLAESFEEFGQIETIAIGPNNEVYNGHQRLAVLKKKHGGDFEIECRQSSRKLTEKEREKLTIYLHKGATGEWDWDALANDWEYDELIEWGFNEEGLMGINFHPEINPEIANTQYSEEQIQKIKQQMGDAYDENAVYRETICPHCGEEYYLKEEIV